VVFRKELIDGVRTMRGAEPGNLVDDATDAGA